MDATQLPPWGGEASTVYVQDGLVIYDAEQPPPESKCLEVEE